jgi:hypothetical protein
MGHEEVPVFQAVVTRFNMVLSAFRRPDYRIAEAAMDDWLANRTAIFETVCLPSMLRQTRRPDAWLIGFDALRRDAVARMLDILRPHPWIVPDWQTATDGRHNSLERTFVRALLPMLKSEPTWVLTTRLDNDDALNLSCCQTVYDHARSVTGSGQVEGEFWISFPQGAQLASGDCRILTQENNPFLSRCIRIRGEDRPKEATVLARNHKYAFGDSASFLLSSEKPMWLQYVHGTNLKNFKRKVVKPTKDARPPAISAVLFEQPRQTGTQAGLRGSLGNLRDRLMNWLSRSRR